jgi:hypothetical protein
MAIANITGNILTDSGISTSSLLPLSGGTITGFLTSSKSITTGENGQISIIPSTNTSAAFLQVTNTDGTTYFGKNNNSGSYLSSSPNATLVYSTGSSPIMLYTNGNMIMTLTGGTPSVGGNVLINTTSDNGAKLQVSGSATFSSSLTIGSTFNITTEAWLQFLGNNVLVADGDFTILQTSGTGLMRFRNNSAQNLLTLANNGAATFSSATMNIGTSTSRGNVTIEQTTINAGLVINSAIAESPKLYLRDGGGAGYSEIQANNNLYLNASKVGIGTSVATNARFNVFMNDTDPTFGSKIQAVFGPSTYLDSDATNIFGGGTSESQFTVGNTARPAMISLGGNVNTGEAIGVINFFRSSNTDGYRSRVQIWTGLNTTGTSNQHGGFLAISTASDNATNPQERMRITSGGVINTTSRLNVNGAGDNSLFSLINNGTTYTLGFSPNASASTSTTLTITTATTTWIYNGTGTATWTLPNPSGTNQMFWIRNAGTGVLTLNAFSGTNIVNTSNSLVSSITIAVGATALIQQDGNIRSYQLQ